MRLSVKQVFSGLLKLLLSVVGFIFVYIAISGLLMLFPVNKSAHPVLNTKTTDHKVNSVSIKGTSNIENSQSTTILIQYGLAHTNIVISLSRSSLDWEILLPDLVPNQIKGQEGYLLVGWGDKETYQSTPNWGDLKASVAIRALLINTPSALHVRYLDDLARVENSVIPLKLNQAISDAVEKRILSSFRNDKPEILSSGYDAGDRFYYSKGKYNIFNTCNTWTGDVLRQSGVNMSLWTPFSYNVVHSLSNGIGTAQ